MPRSSYQRAAYLHLQTVGFSGRGAHRLLAGPEGGSKPTGKPAPLKVSQTQVQADDQQEAGCWPCIASFAVSENTSARRRGAGLFSGESVENSYQRLRKPKIPEADEFQFLPV